MLIIGGTGFGKTNYSLFNLISQQPDIDKIFLHAKDLYESKYQFLINKQESTELNHLNYSKAFIKCSDDMDDIYKNIEKKKPNKKRKILIVFDDMIPDMLSNKNVNPTVAELFIWGRKLNISLVFITQSYFAVPKKKIKINSMQYFIMTSPNKRELQQIAFNDSSNIDSKDFMNLYKKCTAKPYSFLVIMLLLL